MLLAVGKSACTGLHAPVPNSQAVGAAIADSPWDKSQPISSRRPSVTFACWNRDGDRWKGSPFNVLNVILAVSVLTPLAGLAFAYWSFGRLWG